MHPYFVQSAEKITPSTLLLTLERDHDETRLFSFQPGQYAAINIRRKRPSVARCFSVVSSPTNPDILQFSMRVRGKFTTNLATLKPGDEVDVRGPYGGFILDSARDHSAVLLAGGIGITPFMSMIKYATTVRLATPLTLVYSVASQDDVPFLDTLRTLSAANHNLRVVFVVGKGDTDKLADFPVTQGFVTPEILDAVSEHHYGNTTFFICGPPPFMNAAIKTLHAKGTPQERIITEAFSQGSHRQTGKIISWPKNMYALGGVGFALSAIAIAGVDIMKTLPNISFSDTKTLSQPLTSSTSRENDLDDLISQYESNLHERSDSPKTQQAKDAASESITETTTTPQPTQTAPPPSTTTPAPAPAPVCTTTQSGVTTCV